MRRILITGADSYIGTGVEQYLLRYNAAQGRELYRVDTVSQLEDSWKNYDFASYDTVFHVTGIAHADVGNVTEETRALYYRVNRDLALETAQKAREQGVKQFIYMSSIIVYGESAPAGGTKRITADTPLTPANFYGDSKKQAEEAILPLTNEQFQVAVLRPPMIYGPNSKGNYPLLARLAGITPVFPKLANERSMLYLENLAEFVRLLIDSGRGGIFFPQNTEYVTTAQMVRAIGEARGRRVYLWKLLNPFVRLAGRMPGKIGRLVNKAFGSLTVDKALSTRDFDGYCKFSFEESIRRTENGRTQNI